MDATLTASQLIKIIRCTVLLRPGSLTKSMSIMQNAFDECESSDPLALRVFGIVCQEDCLNLGERT